MPEIDAIDLQSQDLDQPLPLSADASSPTPAPVSDVQNHLDISGALEAVHLTAEALNAMEARIDELEAHNQALESSIRGLDAQSHQVADDLNSMTEDRDTTATVLKAENERGSQLEVIVAQHASRVFALERDLGATRDDIAKIVEAVAKTFGVPN